MLFSRFFSRNYVREKWAELAWPNNPLPYHVLPSFSLEWKQADRKWPPSLPEIKNCNHCSLTKFVFDPPFVSGNLSVIWSNNNHRECKKRDYTVREKARSKSRVENLIHSPCWSIIVVSPQWEVPVHKAIEECREHPWRRHQGTKPSWNAEIGKKCFKTEPMWTHFPMQFPSLTW